MKKIYMLTSLILIVPLIIGFYLWQYEPSYKDFGLNLFTEIIGIAFTVLIIDLFLKFYNKKQIKPTLVLTYMQIIGVLNSILESSGFALIKYRKAFIFGEKDCLITDIKDLSKNDLNLLFIVDESNKDIQDKELDTIIYKMNEQRKLLNEIYNSRVMDYLEEFHNDIYSLIHELDTFINSREEFIELEIHAGSLVNIYFMGIFEVIINLQKTLYQKSDGFITYQEWQKKVLGKVVVA
jgi:hypothetical protein